MQIGGHRRHGDESGLLSQPASRFVVGASGPVSTRNPGGSFCHPLLAQYETSLHVCDCDDAIPRLFFHLGTRIVVFRQSLSVERKSTNDVIFALARDEAGAAAPAPVEVRIQAVALCI
jgi:hypothetical protein